MKDKFLSLPDGNICYQIEKNSGRAVIFLHGGGGSLSAWRELRHLFQKTNNRLIFIDLFGHGKSIKPKDWQNYQIEKHTDRLLKVIECLKINKVILVGHCLGSMVAATFSAKYPNKISKLILINTGYVKHTDFLYQITKIITNLAFYFFNTFPFFKTPSYQRVNYQKYKGSANLSLRRIWADIKASGLYPLVFQLKAILHWNGGYYFGKIISPTLIIAGKQDIIFPVSVNMGIHKLIRNSQIKIINSNHISVINEPKKVYEEINTFLLGNHTGIK